jgi:hypothetical protein
VLSNAQFRAWRMSPSAPGVDVSSRHLIDDIPNSPIVG